MSAVPPTRPIDRAARAAAEHAYREAARHDPRIAPHAGLVFETIEELGAGGMGVVLRVRDRRLGRPAALKLIRREAAGAGGVARFIREARIMARLDHPSIPPVYEAGKTPRGEHYILMRLIDGEPLSRAIARSLRAGDAERRRLLEALVRVGEAIAYAHARGVLHRDLKPDNVILGRFGEVMVVDWGIARSDADPDEAPLQLEATAAVGATELAAAGLTQAGTVLGTPGYMPPEQASGREVDERADVFALGAMLTEILTGEPPVAGRDQVHRIMATLKGGIATPRERRPELPADLDAIAAAALRADPRRRTRSASAFVADLRAWLADRPVAAHRYSARERLAGWTRRHPTAVLALAILALAVTIVAVGLSVAARARRRTREAAAALEAARERSETRRRTIASLAEVSELLRRGRETEPVERAVARGLALWGEEPPLPVLLAVASVYEGANLRGQGIATLELAAAHPGAEADAAVLRLHLLTVERDEPDVVRSTPWLERLERRATERGDEEGDHARFARAVTHHAAGELVRAAELYERVAAATADGDLEAIARTHLALVLRARDQPEAARTQVERATSARPNVARGWLVRALLEDDLAARIEHLGRAVGLAPLSAWPYLLRSEALAERAQRRPSEQAKLEDLVAACEDANSFRGLIRESTPQRRSAGDWDDEVGEVHNDLVARVERLERNY